MNNFATALAVKKASMKKKMAKGGEAMVDDVPEADPKSAQAMQDGAMSGGETIKQAMANLKEGFRSHPSHVVMAIMNRKMAKGGMADKESHPEPHPDSAGGALDYHPDEDKVKKMQQAFGMAEGGMVVDPDFLSDEEDDSHIWSMEEPEEDSVSKRKTMLSSIMRSLK